jgi:hypothetical protein
VNPPIPLLAPVTIHTLPATDQAAAPGLKRGVLGIIPKSLARRVCEHGGEAGALTTSSCGVSLNARAGHSSESMHTRRAVAVKLRSWRASR